MGYRIVYEQKRRHFPWWLLLPAVSLLWKDGWYETLARYVGAAIYGH